MRPRPKTKLCGIWCPVWDHLRWDILGEEWDCCEAAAKEVHRGDTCLFLKRKEGEDE